MPARAPATARAAPAAVPSAVLVAFAAASMVAALWAALLYAPTETQGDVQRIFYVHVPAALTMYLAITLLFIASLLYLQSRQARWDEVGAAAAEAGLVFGTIVLTTGPVWAKPVWGTWWTWDARLTSFFILWLIFVAYVMLRAYGGPPEQVARFCAVLAVLGFIGMPITHYSVEWWRTMHPEPIVMTEGGLGAGLPDRMLAALAVGQVAALALFATLFSLRLRLERQTRRVDELRRHIDNQETAR
ncbi:MAG TPA: cytochrome c biogenesis protein CcsA [Acidobacteriota bacterium]